MLATQQITYPKPLPSGGTVAFISPASQVKPELVLGAAEAIRAAGFNVKIMPNAVGSPSGSYAASEQNRLDDFMQAWADPEVDAIICTRGGYGAIHWIDLISDQFLQASPKWLVGFSDVSAIHARLLKAGIASIHGSMAKYIYEEKSTLQALLNILCDANPKMNYRASAAYPGPAPAKPMSASGTLKGGNLAVLSHLIATPCDIFAGQGDILFIEDISEAIYASERMLWQLHLSGALHRANGLIIGSFTDSRPDANFPNTQSMIYSRLKQWGYLDKIPVAFGFDIGHIPTNIPLIEGAFINLSCDSNSCSISTKFPLN